MASKSSPVASWMTYSVSRRQFCEALLMFWASLRASSLRQALTCLLVFTLCISKLGLAVRSTNARLTKKGVFALQALAEIIEIQILSKDVMLLQIFALMCANNVINVCCHTVSIELGWPSLWLQGLQRDLPNIAGGGGWNRYFPFSSKGKDTEFRIPAHADAELFTLLFQQPVSEIAIQDDAVWPQQSSQMPVPWIKQAIFVAPLLAAQHAVRSISQEQFLYRGKA